MSKIRIVKLYPDGSEKLRYTGEVITRNTERVIIEAHFHSPDGVYNGVEFKNGDLFYETYYRDRWYNIFEVIDKDSGKIKCWYCNITRKPKVTRWNIIYEDLALDLQVLPDGTQQILDEEELDDLHLAQAELDQVWAAMRELQSLFTQPAGINLRRDSVVKRYVA
jgi:uncharacterized protein